MTMAIEKQTTAKESDTIYVDASPSRPVTFSVVGTLGSSEIDVYVVDEDGETNELYNSDGEAVVMTATSEPLSFYAPIWIMFDKPVTVAEAGVQQY